MKNRLVRAPSVLLVVLTGGCGHSQIQSTPNAEVKAEAPRVAGIKEQIVSWSKEDVRPIKAVSFSPNGVVVASAGDFSLKDHSVVKIWQTQTGAFWSALSIKNDSVYSIAFINDQTLAIGCDTTIRLWDFNTGHLQKTIQNPSNERALSLAFSEKTNLIAVGGQEQWISLWDVLTGHMKREINDSDFSDSMVFSPDGNILFSAGLGRKVRSWDPQTGKLLRTLQGDYNEALSVAASANGRWVAGGCSDGVVRLWEVHSGKLVRAFRGHKGSVNAVSFAPDALLLASGGEDKTIKLWDTASGRLLRTLQGHKGAVNAIAFNRDGSVLASGSDDKTLRVWRLK